MLASDRRVCNKEEMSQIVIIPRVLVSRFLLHALALLLGVGGALPAPVAQAYTFVTVDVHDAVLTEARGINNRGELAGFFADKRAGSFHGVVADKETADVLSGPNTGALRLFDLNTCGQGVGKFTDGQGHSLGVVTQNGAILTVLDVPGATLTSAEGINTKGQIVGYYVDILKQHHGFIYDKGVFHTLDVPGATFTEPHGINDTGQIVGTYVDTKGQYHGFVYDQGEFTSLDVPSPAMALFTQARGINNAGRIVGYYVAGGHQHGFVYARGVFSTLDVPGATDTFAYHVNMRGQIVGTYRDQQGRSHGFVATPERAEEEDSPQQKAEEE